MREYGFSALTSVISERSASSSRMVRIAFIPAVPPPMIRCRRDIIQSFSALAEFRSFHRSARSSDDPHLAPRLDAPRLARPVLFSARRVSVISPLGSFVGRSSPRTAARRASAPTTPPFPRPPPPPPPPRPHHRPPANQPLG